MPVQLQYHKAMVTVINIPILYSYLAIVRLHDQCWQVVLTFEVWNEDLVYFEREWLFLSIILLIIINFLYILLKIKRRNVFCTWLSLLQILFVYFLTLSSLYFILQFYIHYTCCPFFLGKRLHAVQCSQSYVLPVFNIG